MRSGNEDGCTFACGELLLPPKPPAPMIKTANWLVHTSSPLSVFVSTVQTRRESDESQIGKLSHSTGTMAP